jgi:hypothetical protein
MSKPLLGLILGGILGIFDGWSALWTAGDDPAVRRDIVMIVSMGAFKGMVAGIAVGFFARKFRSLPLGIVFGLVIGVALAAPIAILQGKYYFEIMIPGGLVGLIVGLATQFAGKPAVTSQPSVKPERA